MRKRNAQRGRYGSSCSNSADDSYRYSRLTKRLNLFAAPAEYQRVAAFDAGDTQTGASGSNHTVVNEFLTR